MTNPYRAMCAELLEALEIQLDELRFNNRLCIRARALLAEPLKELALAKLVDAYDEGKIDDTAYDTIRRALEALDD